MRLSIRARLTLWYCSIVVAVLVTGAVAGSFAQSRLSLQRLDDDLVRAMATLQGVMRTEFGEGLSSRRRPRRPASKSSCPIAP